MGEYILYFMFLPQNVKQIMQTLINNGFEAYVIGGAVRDYILGIDPKDYDVFTSAKGGDILRLFPKGKVLGNENRQSKILTVIVDTIEVSSYRTNGNRTETGISLDQHMSTCDFCCNAMACDINGNIIDKHNGIAQLKDKILSCVGDTQTRIDEDQLRILRAIRFSLKYGMTMDQKLREVILNTSLTNIAQERITEELLKILKYKIGYTKDMITLLNKIIPKFNTLDRNGGKFHNESVDEHCIMCHDNMVKLTQDPLLLFVALMHDIGKGSDKFPDPDMFMGHDEEGAHMIVPIMERMKFSKDEINFAHTMIKYHMYGLGNKQMHSLYSEYVKYGIDLRKLMLLSYCDTQANMKKPRQTFYEFMLEDTLLQKFYEMYYSSVPFKVSDLKINGKDVMAMGITDGPTIGNILRSIYEKVINSEIDNDRITLMSYMKQRYGPAYMIRGCE